MTGLLEGQKVQIYNTSDVKIYEATVGVGGDHLDFDISASEYPMYGYLKVYATDGITLIEVTATIQFCGGDTWYWVSPYGTLKAETSAFVIIRDSGTGSPKSATITATLLKPDTTPAVGKTVYFSTSKGEVLPTSGETDANGQCTTELTSDEHGLAVVKVNWPGDGDVPACVAWATHHVLYDAEVADATKKFQFYVEGVELDFDTGSYSLSTETTPQEFTVTIPEWNSLIVRRGLVSIYRLGVKEFSGVLTGIDRDLGTTIPVTLSGVDSKALLNDRVVTLKDYLNDSLADILDDLLDTYPCGITLGTVGPYPASLSITISDESLVSSVSRLMNVIGWLYRVTTDNTLDVMSSFGQAKPNIVFEQGVNLFHAKHRINDSTVSNSIRARGKETLVSTQFDPASIEELGILEGVLFQKSLDIQTTLDLAVLAELGRLVGGTTEISGDVIDAYRQGLGRSMIGSQLQRLTLISPALYKVVKITRNMRDPKAATIECSNRVTVELGDLVSGLRRELKDLSAKSSI